MNIFSNLVHLFLVIPFQIAGFLNGIIKRSFEDGDWKAAQYKLDKNKKERSGDKDV